MPSSSSRGGTPRTRRASSPSAPARPGASARPDDGRRSGGTRRGEPSRSPDPGVAGRTSDAAAWPVRRLAVLALIVLVLAIMLVPTVRRYLDQRAQIAALSEHIATKKADVAELARRRAVWDDPAYIEAQARERLHFVKAGETGYTLTTRQDAQTARTDAQVVGVDAAAAALPWYAKVWGSVEAADRLGSQVQRTTPDPATSSRTVPTGTPAPMITDTAAPPTTPGTSSSR